MTLTADKIKQDLATVKQAFEDTVKKLEDKITHVRDAISKLEAVSAPALIRALEAELEHAKAELLKLKGND